MNYFSLYLKGLICFCLLFITMDSHALSIDKGYRQNKIKDLALIYQGGVHRIDWTSDQFLPYVVHQFADGHKDWLFVRILVFGVHRWERLWLCNTLLR